MVPHAPSDGPYVCGPKNSLGDPVAFSDKIVQTLSGSGVYKNGRKSLTHYPAHPQPTLSTQLRLYIAGRA